MSAPTVHWLHEHWVQLCCNLAIDATLAEPAFADLVARYSHPERHYHHLEHLRHVLATIDELKNRACNLAAIQLAAWFHDAVYDTRAQDNEEQSAILAREVLDRLAVPKPLIERAVQLILLTKTHRAAPDDLDGQIFLDADLAILGAPEADYRAYAQAIRREYAWVPDADYRKGRAAVLQRFAARPAIFHCPPMVAQCESAARRNLENELRALA